MFILGNINYIDDITTIKNTNISLVLYHIQ